MIRWRRGRVRQILPSWPGAVLCTVVVEPPGGNPEKPASTFPVCRALAYPDLVGTPEVGDTVLLNTGALDLGLGPVDMRWWWLCPSGCPPTVQNPVI